MSFPAKCYCKDLNTEKAKIPRPRNAFIMYRQFHHGKLPADMNISEKSKVIAKNWKTLPEEEKSKWQNAAAEERRVHKLKYPDFQYHHSNAEKNKTVLKKKCLVCQEKLSILAETAATSLVWKTEVSPPRTRQQLPTPPLVSKPGFPSPKTNYTLAPPVENYAGRNSLPPINQLFADAMIPMPSLRIQTSTQYSLPPPQMMVGPQMYEYQRYPAVNFTHMPYTGN